jgi:putative FmdB family regulatory protein
MPLYEYSCEKCKMTFEVTQSFSDPPIEDCPDCGERVKKLMSLGGFALKGQGWYATDYKRNTSSTGTGAE